jgi:predicted dienelactone hydrolase
VTLWYPARRGSSATLPYLPSPKLARQVLPPDQYAALAELRSHATAAGFVADTSRFPVLVFSHGHEMAAFFYSSLHEELASHGFIVIGVDHPGSAVYATVSRGTVLRPRNEADSGSDTTRRLPWLDDQMADLHLVLSRLHELRVGDATIATRSANRIGAFGHSRGALAASLLCQVVTRVDACASLDGRIDGRPLFLRAGTSLPARPFLYVAKPFRRLTDAELVAEGVTWERAEALRSAAYARDRQLLRAAGATTYLAIVQGAVHETFSDEPLIVDPADREARERMEAVRALVLEFFRATLVRATPSTLAPRSGIVTLERLRP